MKEITIQQARNRIIKAFKECPDFRDTYVANIACIIMDNVPGYMRNKAKRDVLANKILRHILS